MAATSPNMPHSTTSSYHHPSIPRHQHQSPPRQHLTYRTESDSILSHSEIRSRDPSSTMHSLSSSPGNGGYAYSSFSTPFYSSPEYVQHSKDLITKMRDTHEAERIMWHLERDDLQRRIKELEDRLTKVKSVSYNQNQLLKKVSHPALCDASDLPQEVRSPNSTIASSRPSSNGSYPKTSSGEVRRSSAGGEGSPVMRAVYPPNATSTFVPLPTSNRQPTRLESISEHTSPSSRPSTAQQQQRVRVDPIPPPSYKPSISTADASVNLDGINFKKHVVVDPETLSNNKKAAVAADPHTPPAQIINEDYSENAATPLPHVDLSNTNALSQSRVPVLSHLNSDPYTAHGGHTPLVKTLTGPMLDHTASSEDLTALRSQESAMATAQFDYEEDVEIKRPSERRDSYFPVAAPAEVDDDRGQDVQDDPALTGLLGLEEGQDEANAAFLEKLDQQLAVQKSIADVAATEEEEGIVDGQATAAAGGLSPEKNRIQDRKDIPRASDTLDAVTTLRKRPEKLGGVAELERTCEDYGRSLEQHVRNENVVNGGPVSISATSAGTGISRAAEKGGKGAGRGLSGDGDGDDDALPLKKKQSTNFGRPFGEA